MRMLLMGIVAGLLVSLAWAAPAPAAEDQAAAQVAGLKAEILALQNKGRLGIGNLQACERITGYGAYIPLPAAQVAKDGTLNIYYEPGNWFTRVTGGRYVFQMIQDIVLLDAKGSEVFRKNEALTIRHDTARPVIDLYVYNNLDVTGLTPGRYTYRIVLHDSYKEGTAAADLAFEIRP